MAENSNIGWTHHTFNPWIGCTKLSPACKNCYAEKFAGRYLKIGWGDRFDRYKTTTSWKNPLKWNAKCDKAGVRQRVFCASLADVCEDHPSIQQAWRDELMAMIRATPHLDWLLLTKRPENFTRFYGTDLPVNLWVGITAEDQLRYNERAPHLHAINATIRFISSEPLLGRITLNAAWKVDWVIIGGETGELMKISQLNLTHVQAIIEQCDQLGLHVFFKQLGRKLARSLQLKDNWAGAYPEEYPLMLTWLKRQEVPHLIDKCEPVTAESVDFINRAMTTN